jgi:methionyl-tRNA formyltransferase
MRIAFAGTPEFAVPSLQAIASKHDLLAIICQPDRGSGRGRKIRSCAIKQAAETLDIDAPIYQPTNIQELLPTLQTLQIDIIIVVAYGQLLRPQILQLPRFGCINVHASLLPRWRGAAPIQRAIEAGDELTGISIMQMAEGLDNGDILHTQHIEIGEDNAAELGEKLSLIGANLLVETLDNIQDYQKQATTQQEQQACYAKKLTKEQAKIDWQRPIQQITQQIRAFNPTPICHTTLFNQHLRIYQAKSSNQEITIFPKNSTTGNPFIHKKQLFVHCQDGWIELLKIQPSGKKPMPVADFLNGINNSTKT